MASPFKLFPGRNMSQRYWVKMWKFALIFVLLSRWFFFCPRRLHSLPWTAASSLSPHPSHSPYPSTPSPHYLRRCHGSVICRKLTSAEQVCNPYDPLSPFVPLDLNSQFLSVSTINSLFEEMPVSKTHYCMPQNQRGLVKQVFGGLPSNRWLECHISSPEAGSQPGCLFTEGQAFVLWNF